MLIDAHVHVWDAERLAYPWLAAVPALARRYDVADYRAACAPARPDAWVFVQAECTPAHAVAEADWVAGLADAPAAIVAHAPVEDAAALAATLDAYAARPRVRGIRRNVQGERAGFARDAAVIAGVRQVAARGLPFDVCCTHDQLADVAALVAAVPEGRFVLDHCGKPPVRTGDRRAWQAALAAIARRPNVVCKLSGLATEADPAAWDAATVAPWLEAALGAFGPARCLFGSDWPVLTLAGPWSAWHEAVAAVVAPLDAADREAVWWRTAATTYGIAVEPREATT